MKSNLIHRFSQRLFFGKEIIKDEISFGDSFLDKAHKACIYNRNDILSSSICGCFYCLYIFDKNEITEWTDIESSHGQTALCPKCEIDSVLGDSSGFAITKDFLEQMNLHWFSS